ncbi:MAG: hypothetical protein ACTHZM_06105 [Canibacter sp.]
MSKTNSSDVVKTDEERIREIERNYEEVFGSVPPSLDTRLTVFSGQQREAVIAFEEARSLAVMPPGTSQKDVQLMQFAVYLATGSEGGATHHGATAIGHGATLDDLGLATHIALLASGMSALHLGVKIMKNLQDPGSE